MFTVDTCSDHFYFLQNLFQHVVLYHKFYLFMYRLNRVFLEVWVVVKILKEQTSFVFHMVRIQLILFFFDVLINWEWTLLASRFFLTLTRLFTASTPAVTALAAAFDSLFERLVLIHDLKSLELSVCNILAIKIFNLAHSWNRLISNYNTRDIPTIFFNFGWRRNKWRY
jgi:hypothetical protein